MEVDFNFNNKILERYLMKYTERGGNTPKEKYGSRKVKIHYAHCQQTTALWRDKLTTTTCYPL